MKPVLFAAAMLGATLVSTGVAAQTAPVAAADPARLTVAESVVGRLLPPGTYRRMMDGTMQQLMDMSMKSVLDMPMESMLAAAGVKPRDGAKPDQATMREVMAIMDPAFEQRTKVGMDTMMAEMVTVMDTMEPRVRTGLSRAYAAKFSAAELAELDRFFATPTGGRYAAESIPIMMDPAVMQEMQAMIPELMGRMPDIIAKVTKATEALPKPRKPEDLTPAERKQLEDLLGKK